MGVCGVSLLLIDSMATAKKEAWEVANYTVTVFFDNELQEKQIKSHFFCRFFLAFQRKYLPLPHLIRVTMQMEGMSNKM